MLLQAFQFLGILSLCFENELIVVHFNLLDQENVPSCKVTTKFFYCWVLGFILSVISSAIVLAYALIYSYLACLVILNV